MKKQYTTPNTSIIRTHTQAMICGSITSNGSGLSVTLGSDDSGSFGDDNTINSRGGSFWDDED